VHGYRADVAFDGERRLPDGALVLVDDGLIVAVEPASAAAPEGCRVTHLRGTSLLPGLVDSHVHLCADSGPRPLEQVPELSAAELATVIDTAERQHLATGVTAVRDLGDHQWAVTERRSGHGATVVAAGPPLTSPGGHCSSMGGETTGAESLRRAVRQRAERGAGVVKIMASGGVMTPGIDVLACQFSLEEMLAVVGEAHDHGLSVTAHAHGLPAVERSIEAGVDGIEHCSCLTPHGPRLPQALADRLAAAGTYVCPSLGRVPGVEPPPHVQARLEAVGARYEDHLLHVAKLRRAGVTLVAGTTAVAARACGLEGRTGRLATGLDADILLVDGDPLLDITALQQPRMVVSRGRRIGD
jgi:imidazolonepropionase-like amidohydrolase